MVHPDHETRVGAHRVFSVVLVPSSVCPRPRTANHDAPKEYDFRRTLSRTVSVFSSSAALFDKLRRDKPPLRENICQESGNRAIILDDGLMKCNNDAAPIGRQPSQSRIHSMRNANLSFSDEKSPSISYKDMVCRTELYEKPSYFFRFHGKFHYNGISDSVIETLLLVSICCASGTNFYEVEHTSDHTYAFINLGSSHFC